MAGVAAETRPRNAWLRRLASALWLGLTAAPPVHAGAWVAPEGGQVIASIAGHGSENAGVAETQLYVEQPIANGRFALVGKPWYEISIDERGLVTERSETDLGLKAVLHRGERYAAAIQASALWASDPYSDCSDAGGELRGLAGRTLFGGRGFLNAEAGVRTFGGDCARGRFDFTFGYRPAAAWLALAETFTDAPDGGDSTVKAQLSLVGFFRGGAGLQAGVRFRADDPGAEPALVLGFWAAPRLPPERGSRH